MNLLIFIHLPWFSAEGFKNNHMVATVTKVNGKMQEFLDVVLDTSIVLWCAKEPLMKYIGLEPVLEAKSGVLRPPQ